MDKWLRRKRNSLGYGVQSPSDFYFVQHVLREEAPYYGYAVLERMAKTCGTSLPCYPKTIDRLLFRLANHVHPGTMVEVGAGFSVFAMAMACPSARCIAVTSSEIYGSTIQPMLSDNLRVEVRNGDEKAVFGNLLCEVGGVDMLHVAHTPYYRDIVDAVLPYVTSRTLIVIEDIRATKEKRDWWRELQESRFTGISYDLGSVGLLFFDRSRHKDTYWVDLKD